MLPVASLQDCATYFSLALYLTKWLCFQISLLKTLGQSIYRDQSHGHMCKDWVSEVKYVVYVC